MMKDNRHDKVQLLQRLIDDERGLAKRRCGRLFDSPGKTERFISFKMLLDALSRTRKHRARTGFSLGRPLHRDTSEFEAPSPASRPPRP